MFITNDRGKGSNGVIARDFIQFDKRIPAKLTGAFQRLNEQTAHLSKNRTVDPKKKFTIADARKVQDWLMPAMISFVDGLPLHYRERWNSAETDPTKFQVQITVSSLSATNVIQTLTYTTSPPGTFRIIK